MTVKQLRQILFEVDDQDMTILVDDDFGGSKELTTAEVTRWKDNEGEEVLFFEVK